MKRKRDNSKCSVRRTSATDHYPVFLILFLLVGILIAPIGEGALTDDVFVHDIDPPGTYSQNISHGDTVHFVFVVEYNGTGDNVTILLSNSSSEQGWNVGSSADSFILSQGESNVIRISIRPDSYTGGMDVEIDLRILIVRDSESHEITRTYSVALPKESDGDGSTSEDDDSITIVGFEVEVPEPLNSKVGKFLLLTTFWVLVTIVVLVMLDPFVKTFTRKTETDLDDVILGIIRKPIFVLIIIYGLIESLDTLDPPTEILDILSKIYGIVFFTTAIYTAYKVFQAALLTMDNLASKTSLGSKVHHALIPSLSKVGSIIFFFIGLNVILGYLGFDLALLLGGMTIMGLVIAFAAQDTLSNFFGGIFLILEPNFKKADTIILQGTTYDVVEIGMRTTQLYDISNHALVIIPNNLLANEKIVTLTEPDRHIKMNIEIGVAYGTDVDLVENTLLTIAKSHPEIITDTDEMPFVRFNAFGASSLDFKLVFWVNDLNARFRVRHEIMKRVNKKFEELDIEIPFPQRVITMVGDGSTDGTDDAEDGERVDQQEAVSLEDPFIPTSASIPSLTPAPIPSSTPSPTSPPPKESLDPAATAEVKGETMKPHEEVIREKEEETRKQEEKKRLEAEEERKRQEAEEEEELRQQATGNVDSDGFDSDGGGDGGGGDGGDE